MISHHACRPTRKGRCACCNCQLPHLGMNPASSSAGSSDMLWRSFEVTKFKCCPHLAGLKVVYRSSLDTIEVALPNQLPRGYCRQTQHTANQDYRLFVVAVSSVERKGKHFSPVRSNKCSGDVHSMSRCHEVRGPSTSARAIR